MQTRIQEAIERISEIISQKESVLYSKNIKVFSNLARNEKHYMSSKFILADGKAISNVLFGKTFYVTKKLDGIFLFICVWKSRGKYVVKAFNSNGKMIENLPCILDFEKTIKDSENKNIEIKSQIYCAELYVKDQKRTRVNDVLHSLSSNASYEEKEKLCIAPFYCYLTEQKSYNHSEEFFEDFLEERIKITNHYTYSEIHSYLEELFKDSKYVNPVPLETFNAEDCSLENTEAQVNNSSKTLVSKVQDVYNKWVLKESAEGLVVRNENNIIWKIKPRHTIDAAAIGFALDLDGTLRDIMFAVLDKENRFHRFAAGTTGLTKKQKEEYLAFFMQNKAESSNFLCSNSLGIPYQMVKPKKVFEISCVDLSSEKAGSVPCKNDLLVFEENCWLTKGLVNGCSVHALSVERERDDKSCVYEDIRLEQLSDISPFVKDSNETDLSLLPKSEILERHIYTKKTGKKYFVKKFVIWKTNKEYTKLYAPYILHFTDYSSGRGEPLQKDFFEANSLEEAQDLFTSLASKKIKGGWTYVFNI